MKRTKFIFPAAFAAVMALAGWNTLNAENTGEGGAPTEDVVPVTGITVSPQRVEVYQGDNVTITASVSPGNATVKDVVWSISDNVRDITLTPNGNSVCVALGKEVTPGEYTIIASSADNAVSDACSLVVLRKAKSISLNRRDITLFPGETVDNLQAYLHYSDGTMSSEGITWTIEREDVAVVSGPGQITGVATGWTKLLLTGGGLSLTASIHVLPEMESISVTPSELTMGYGETRQVTATILPSSAASAIVSWSLEPAKPKNVTIDKKGNITTTHDQSGADTPQIVYAVASAGGMSAKCKVNIVVPVTGLTLSPNTINLEPDETCDVTATLSPEGAYEVPEWDSSDPTVATVEGTTEQADDLNKVIAHIKAHNDGSTILTAKIREISAICLVTVKSTSGITEIKTDVNALCDVYDLNGNVIAKQMQLSSLPSRLATGVYIIQIGSKAYKISL